jgi:protein-S-isoprenylcysteine O-methyltransferase Ste14
MADVPPRVDSTGLAKLILRATSKSLAALVLMGALLFGPAGRLDWMGGWVFLAVMVVVTVVALAILARVNPEVIRARVDIHWGAKRFDKFLVTHLIVAMLAMFVVAGLDAGRYHWSTLFAAWVWVGIALQIPGTAVMIWAMSVNPFLEPTVRIQTDRGQHVISTGPYRFIRHPSYAAMIPLSIGWPLILGSLWAFVPVGLMVMWAFIRTAFEDRMLQRELPGYAEYVQRTKYRLVPFVW